MILLVFAIALLLAAVATWGQLRRRAAVQTVQFITGLGDLKYYSKLSENDFYNPALVSADFPRGIFRRTVNPVHREDGKMRLQGLEKSGHLCIYTDAKPKPGPDGSVSKRWYVKAADNRYIEFGERKFWPSYAPVKS